MPDLLDSDLPTNYIISIMTNSGIGVIVIVVKNKADQMSPERKESWQQLISLRIVSCIICIANIMKHCSVEKKNRVWLRCTHVR